MQQKILFYKMGAVFALVFTLGYSDLDAVSLLRYLLGTEPVSAEMQEIADKADALTHFKTPVLQMNWLAKRLPYSTFNWFNTTWVDEEALKNNPEFATLWQLIHEKWHTIWKHDVRRIIGVSSIVTSVLFKIFLTAQLTSKGWNGYTLSQKAAETFSCTHLPLLTLFLFLWHEEYCESQADAYADRVLKDITESSVDAA